MPSQEHDLDQKQIHYRCVAPDHADAVSTQSGLTIHEGRWAYCTAGHVLSEHRWAPTGGVRIADLRTREADYDNALLAALSGAERMYLELRQTVGATSFRLEIARPGAPLTIDLGERWGLLRALAELQLVDGSGCVGRVLIGDDRRDDYHDPERETARRIVSAHVAILRRWLTAHASR